MIKMTPLIGIHGPYGLGKLQMLLLLLVLNSCFFSNDKEFSYSEYEVDTFLNSDLEFKSTNECTEGKCLLKYVEKDNQIKTSVYMTYYSGLSFEPIIKYDNNELILSVRIIDKRNYHLEDNVIYALKYNISIEKDKKINRVVFLYPNPKNK